MIKLLFFLSIIYGQQPKFIGGYDHIPTPLNGSQTIIDSIKAILPVSIKNSYYPFKKRAMIVAKIHINEHSNVDSVQLLTHSGFLEVDTTIILGLKKVKFY